jgi:hypothetical protein
MNKIKVDGATFLYLHSIDDILLRQVKEQLEISDVIQENYILGRRLQSYIFEYAKARVDVEITVRIKNWTLTNATLRRFVCFAWSMEVVLRSKKRRFKGYKKVLANWIDGKAQEDLDLPNLRFFYLVG